MTRTPRLQKLGLIASLYISQYIPVMFLVQALPVFMRQRGVSLESIALLSLLGLPLILKFIWSPLIDRYGFTRWGHYRFWIICFQLLVAGVTVGCAWLDLEKHFTVLLISAFLMCFLCASQDIATDALAVGLLEPEERGVGNGIQLSGHYLGAAIGGGGMLILLERWGWRNSLLTLALIMIVALIPVLLHREKQRGRSIELASSNAPLSKLKTRNPLASYFQSLIHFCHRPRTAAWLLILATYMAGGNIAKTMFRPLLVDIGLSLADIGWLQGVISDGAGMVGAIAAGFLIVPLGRKRSLVIFGLLHALALTAYLLPGAGITHLSTLYLVAIVTQLSLGAVGTALFTTIMDRTEAATAGTDFTVQTSVVYFGSIGASVLSGAIAQAVGYQGVFLVSIGIALISVGAIAKSFESKGTTHSMPHPSN